MESAGNIRIGTAGWSYKDWEGIVYPARVKRVEPKSLPDVFRAATRVEVAASAQVAAVQR